MKNNVVIIFLLTIVVGAFYFLGKKNGSNNTKVSMIENVALIKEIAELGALSVSGSTTLKSTNKEIETGAWSRLRNYFGENTLNITIPFDAKYGVDMTNQKVEIDTKDSVVTIYLPESKLLSLQLRLDRVDAIYKTGFFSKLTIDDFITAQKHLYENVSAKMEDNKNYRRLAEEHISFILEKYYAPLGLKVICKFGAVRASAKG